MILLRSLCRLFSRCAGEDRKPESSAREKYRPEGDLGQKEAEQEKASEEQLRHMKGDDLK